VVDAGDDGGLFQTTPQNVTLHLKAIYMEGELKEEATCKDYLQVRREGGRQVSRSLRHYSLPAILAIGYRVRSHRGTQFRQWATERLDEYLTKGFAFDDERLKNPPGKGHQDYFDELLERIHVRAGTSVPRNGDSTRRCWIVTGYLLDIYWIFTRRVWTIHRIPKCPNSFLPPCKTRGTGPRTVTRRRRSFTSAPMRPSR